MGKKMYVEMLMNQWYLRLPKKMTDRESDFYVFFSSVCPVNLLTLAQMKSHHDLISSKILRRYRFLIRCKNLELFFSNMWKTRFTHNVVPDAVREPTLFFSKTRVSYKSLCQKTQHSKTLINLLKVYGIHINVI